MRNWRDSQTISQIVAAATEIEDITLKYEWVEFEQNSILKAAILHHLTVIGEAVTRLSDEFKTEHDKLPWSQIVRTRNFIVHVYDAINYARIWQTCVDDVPSLIPYLEPLIPFQDTEDENEE